jgi:hypothetical protein
MTDVPDFGPPDPGSATVEEQLIRAARDLWCMVHASGEDFVVFSDRRGEMARVQRDEGGDFHLAWQEEDGGWTQFSRSFDNLREACFHGFQGPH